MTLFLTQRLSKAKQYASVVAIVVLVAVLCYLGNGIIWYRVVALVLMVTVSLIAMFFSIYPVLLSALLSALIWDYFFIPPYFTLQVSNTEDLLMLLLYFVIASVNAVLTYKLRQIEKIEREQEEKANTIKLYNNLLNSLSHELKTPIATLIGASDNLLENNSQLGDESKQKLYLEISKAAFRLDRQVENLLNMSRLDSGNVLLKRDWCDVHELIHSVLNQMEDGLKGRDVKLNFKEGLPLFKLDFVLMQEVLRNLLSNVIAYTPEGTGIIIDVEYTSASSGHFISNAAQLEAHLDAVHNCLILKISDFGNGFPEEERLQVFEKFYRLKNTKSGGTGLGLSIAKGFVEAHKGQIYLTNIPSGGARFTIEIPTETSFLSYQKNE